MWRKTDAAQVAVLVWLGLLTPPLRAALESSMVLHMLVQLPLLALVGVMWARAWAMAPIRSLRGRVLVSLQRYNRGGVTGLVLAGVTMLLWMLPRWLDAARMDPTVDLIKFLSVPLAFGAVLALSWPRCPPIARAVIQLEGIATLLRFGWGYLAADQRLCLVYLQDDQQRVGVLLLCIAAAWAIAAAWRPLFGPLPFLGRNSRVIRLFGRGQARSGPT